MSPSRKLLCALVLLLAVGCGSAPDPEPAATPAASSTPETAPVTSLPPTATTSPSPTPSPHPAAAQLELLHQASLQYLAGTNSETTAVAQSLEVSPGMTGRSVCGPLAFAILQDAGLVSRSVDLYDVWLLDPPEDSHLLERIFPRVAFEWITITLPIDEVDYRQFPLKAGDLLFIYSGTSGDYSHVLAVTRVDGQGRAYAVTNNYTADGFVIQEYLLYDPAQPGVGLFYEWTDPANASLGLTGFGGFDLWRPKSLPFYADPGSG